MFLKKLFSKNKSEYKESSAPDGSRIYAVGDIHGRLDLLKSINKKIKKDISENKSERNVVIYIGDYVDRGNDSQGVINELINNPIEGAESIHLCGNHENAMMEYFSDPGVAYGWFAWGGKATVRSYGVKSKDKKGRPVSEEQIHELFNELVPDNHKKFLKNLKYYHIEGDYIFVHAGLKPGIPLEKQHVDDMMTIRDAFIYPKTRFEKTVVFGHTVFDQPFVGNGRIGIDTGAYATGRLTAVILEKTNVEFIHT